MQEPSKAQKVASIAAATFTAACLTALPAFALSGPQTPANQFSAEEKARLCASNPTSKVCIRGSFSNKSQQAAAQTAR